MIFRLFVIISFLSIQCGAQDTTRISLLFLGDIMQHDSQIEAAYNAKSGKYDYTECFKLLKPYFESVDLTIGNLELTLGGKPFKGYPQFSAPDELAVTLKDVGVDVLVTANNHSLDRRTKGLDRTIRILDSLSIQHTGTFRDTLERMNEYPLIISRNGIRLVLLNYTYGTNGIPVSKPSVVNLIDTTVIRKDLLRAQELNPDATIVFMHWGDEYQTQPNKVQKQLTSFCFEQGATLVIGSHPHVLQPMEWNKQQNQLVAYSLGNFVSGQRPRNRDGGGMLRVELKKIISDSMTFTSIDTAQYILQWVYKTEAIKKFYILPIPEVEKNPLNLIKDETSLEAYKVFLDDSRRLLKKYNKSIEESASIPEVKIRYKILLSSDTLKQGWQILPPEQSFIFGLEKLTDPSGTIGIFTGNFTRREDAERYRDRIISNWPDCRIVTFLNGKQID